MRPEQFIMAELANYAIRQGYHCGGVTNMVAAAQVIANRVRAGWHGADWLEVLRQAPAVAGFIPPMTPWNMRDAQIRLLLSRIDEVFFGQADDLTEGALYFAELHHESGVIPWFRQHILLQPEQHPRVANVAQMVFFQ